MALYKISDYEYVNTTTISSLLKRTNEKGEFVVTLAFPQGTRDFKFADEDDADDLITAILAADAPVPAP